MVERTLVWYRLDEQRISAIAESARRLGDEGCYLSITEREAFRFRQSPDGGWVEDGPLDWYVALDDLAAHREVPYSGPQHVLLSPRRGYSSGAESAQAEAIEWLEDLKTEGGSRYKKGSDPLSWGWLATLLDHVYGEREAERLLRSTGILD
jgi:hypothetical protein